LRGSIRRDAEKAHAMGALDLALWDIKGKGARCGRSTICWAARRRDFCECYSTSGLPSEVRTARGGGAP